ncbi:MAG TPA: hypothetical protein DCL08_01860 [Anaerolineaceae bacterium]|jgi:hypothetical protein|nr:MAG: hypothetical protein XE06_0647 [Anaerolineaceae bacterium 46_22]HAF47970.1 hypothetical protein [Anaerolineaceae bacterium]
MSQQNYRQTPPPGYGQQTSSLAVISLISGIASYFIIPLIGAIAAIITGNIAMKEIRESAGQYTGESMARWGMILGWINIGLSVVGLCIAVLAIAGVLTLPFCFMPFANMDFMH